MKSVLPLALLLLLSGCSSKSSIRPALSNTSNVAASPQGEQIRANKSSRIYHWPGCPNYDDISPGNRVSFNTRAEAEAAGYRAARNCN